MISPDSNIWNPYRNGYLDDPYESFRLFRKENPVHRGINKQWMLFSYTDVKRILNDPSFETISVSELTHQVNSNLPQSKRLTALAETTEKWLLYLNPPEHTGVRQVVTEAWKKFDLENAIQEIVEDVLVRASSRKEIDIVRDFAIPIPTMVMCRLLGFPVEDHLLIKSWSSAFQLILEQFVTLETLREANKKVVEFQTYAMHKIETKMGSPDNDLISLILIENKELDEPLQVSDIISIISQLIMAGIETTVSLLGQSILELTKNPGQKDLWTIDPSITQKAIEELVRFTNPVQFAPRIPSDDIEFNGILIRKGELIFGSLASANRDPQIFKNPDDLDLNRQPNPHIGFGHGFHYCLGAALGRAEMRIAIPALLNKFPDVALDPAKNFEWEPHFSIRCLSSLPVVLG